MQFLKVFGPVDDDDVPVAFASGGEAADVAVADVDAAPLPPPDGELRLDVCAC